MQDKTLSGRLTDKTRERHVFVARTRRLEEDPMGLNKKESEDEERFGDRPKGQDETDS